MHVKSSIYVYFEASTLAFSASREDLTEKPSTQDASVPENHNVARSESKCCNIVYLTKMGPYFHVSPNTEFKLAIETINP